MEHFRSLQDLGGWVALLHEVDGVFGQLVGLVDIFFEDNCGETPPDSFLHILLSNK